MGALLIAKFMGFLDLFIVTVALPRIRTDLHASFGPAQLVVGVYLVAHGVRWCSAGDW